MDSDSRHIAHSNEMRFTKRSFLLIASGITKLLVQLLVLFLYSARLPVEEYGRYQSIWLYVNFCSVIGLFGLQAMLLSHSAHSILNWVLLHKKKVLVAVFFFNMVPLIYILVAGHNFFWPEKILLCILIVFQNISTIAETLAIKKEAEKKVLRVNTGYYLLFLAIHLWMINSGSFSISLLLVLLIGISVLKTMFLTGTKTKLAVSNTTIQATLGKQWLFLGLHDVIDTVFKWLDKWLILAFVSLQQFAIYFNGSYEIPVYPLLLTAVGNIMLVELSKLKIATPSLSAALYRRAGYFLGAFIFPAFCFLLLFHKEIFLFVFSEKYMVAVPIFLVSIFVLPVRICYYTAALQAYNRNDVILKGSLLDLGLAILLMAILYPLAGLPGLAGAFVLSTYIQSFYYLWHVARLLRCRISSLLPFGYFIIVFLISVAAMAACYMLLKNQPVIVALSTGALLTAIIAIALLIILFKTKKI